MQPQGVTQKRARVTPPSDSQLHTFPVQTLPVFEPPEASTSFILLTSWIPGEGHKGSFRYQVAAWGVNLADSEKATYVKKLYRCDFTLELKDKDDFILRRIKLPLRGAVGPNGALIELDANDATQMDLPDYRSLINGGGFAVSWICP